MYIVDCFVQENLRIKMLRRFDNFDASYAHIWESGIVTVKGLQYVSKETRENTLKMSN